MISKKQYLSGQSGVTLSFLVFLWQDEAKTIPVNLIGHDLTFVVRPPGKPNALPIFVKPLAGGIDGRVLVNVTDEETKALPLGLLAWNLDWETPNGDKHRPFYGPLDNKSGVNV